MLACGVFNIFFKNSNFSLAVFNTRCLIPRTETITNPKISMILNFEIDDQTGERLDEIARREHRSRRAQATKLFLDALELVLSDELSQDTPEEVEA